MALPAARQARYYFPSDVFVNILNARLIKTMIAPCTSGSSHSTPAIAWTMTATPAMKFTHNVFEVYHFFIFHLYLKKLSYLSL